MMASISGEGSSSSAQEHDLIYLLPRNDGSEDRSVDGEHISRKRKTPEDSSGQPCIPRNSFPAQQRERMPVGVWMNSSRPGSSVFADCSSNVSLLPHVTAPVASIPGGAGGSRLPGVPSIVVPNAPVLAESHGSTPSPIRPNRRSWPRPPPANLMMLDALRSQQFDWLLRRSTEMFTMHQEALLESTHNESFFNPMLLDPLGSSRRRRTIFASSLFHGMQQSQEDMNIDVDNMTYEELLALEERIGNVSTGLDEETIILKMRKAKYHYIRLGPPVEEPCCICQEEYEEEEDLGKLNCGHDFHLECIKKWLMHKNICPICKLTAFDV